VGTSVVVTITQPNAIGEALKVVTRAHRRPLIINQCIPPGARDPAEELRVGTMPNGRKR
jgi:hypothetical protein